MHTLTRRHQYRSCFEAQSKVTGWWATPDLTWSGPDVLWSGCDFGQTLIQTVDHSDSCDELFVPQFISLASDELRPIKRTIIPAPDKKESSGYVHWLTGYMFRSKATHFRPATRTECGLHACLGPASLTAILES